ncbi:MAG: magnesium transporter [Planctomycetota bacterium]|jgi:magnesium transporter
MTEEDRQNLEKRLHEILESVPQKDSKLKDALAESRPEDIADTLQDLSDEDKSLVISQLPPEVAGQVILETDPVSQEDILEKLPPDQIADIVDELPPDEGADLVQLVTDKEVGEVLAEVETDAREDVEELLSYPEDTAGGVMTPDLVKLPQTAIARDAIAAIQGEIDAEIVDEIYVVDDRDMLAGVVTLKDLITAPPTVPVLDFMRPPISAWVLDDQERVAKLATRYNLRNIPVTDGDGKLIGVVTADDVIDIIDEEASEDIHRLAGVHGEHPTQQPLLVQFIHRMPWLFVTIFGGIAAAFLANAFSSILHTVGLSGSVGIQSSAMMVRGIATGEIGPGRMTRLLLTQLMVGFLIGLTCAVVLGGFTAIVAPYLTGKPSALLGLVIGAGIVAAASLAALLGTVIPLVAHRVGADPAVVAGPFVTVLIDFSGLFIYLIIAVVFLRNQ